MQNHLYRSSSQSADEFDNFLSKFEDNFFSIMPSHKSSRCCVNDKSPPGCVQIESLTSYYGLTQVINQPTHLLSNSLSCIDLIFTTDSIVSFQCSVFSS